MSVEERDPYTGHRITGHIWNGIKELNSPVPRLWYWSFALAFVFSVGYWIYMPAWPTVNSHTQGLSGFDQRDELDRQISVANAETDTWRKAITSVPLGDIVNNEELMGMVSRAGPALFEDSCAGCHGNSGEGAKNFPALNDTSWLWGSTPEAIYQTLKFGINSGHADSRIGQMPAFGDNKILDSSQIRDVSLYVQSLTNKAIGDGRRSQELLSVRNGERVFATQCFACHGADAGGNPLLGAPSLTDADWLYGSQLEDVIYSVANGRAGLMPAWVNRIDDVKLRILSLYVHRMSEQENQ